MANDCCVVGQPDVAGVILSRVCPVLVVFSDKGSLYVDPNIARREDDLFKGGWSSVHCSIYWKFSLMKACA